MKTKWLIPAITAIATLAIMTMLYNKGYEAGQNKVTAQWEAAQHESAKAAAAILIEYRAQEQQWAADTQRVSDELHSRLQDTQTSADRIIADLHSGNVQLRERFRSCSANAGVSNDSDTTSSNDDAGQTGLSNADAGFLIRLASRADRAVSQLTACQSYVSAIIEAAQ